MDIMVLWCKNWKKYSNKSRGEKSMNLENLELKIEEDVLSFLSSPSFIEEVEMAKNYFYHFVGQGEMNNELHLDFNSWLIYDYKLTDGESFLSKYYNAAKATLAEDEAAFIQQLIDTYLSLYTVIEVQNEYKMMRDIFSKEVYRVNPESIRDIQENELVMGRILGTGDMYWLTGNKQYIPGAFKISIERSMLADFEEFKKKNRYANWNDYLKDHSEVLYKHLGIIEELTIQNEKEGDELYYVWQSVYLIRDTRNIKKVFLGHKEIVFDDEDKGCVYFKMMYHKSILCEMVLKNNRLELECTSEENRDKAKKIIEMILGDNGKHFKDEILSIDDLV